MAECDVEIGLYLRGAILGFSIAAPVGPIGVLCIRRTLAEGRMAGLLSGLGAATADAFYGALAAFGLTAISDLLVGHQSALRLLGGIFLLYLGLRIFFTGPAPAARIDQPRRLLSNYLSTLALTLTNPATILSFVAIFAGLGWAGESGASYGSAALLVAGVFTGSALWWLILSSGVSLIRSRSTPRLLHWVNRISGTVIIGFGVAALVSFAA